MAVLKQKLKTITIWQPL